MNIDTGEIKELHELTSAEKDDDFWKRVPQGKANKEAFEHIENKTKVDLDDNSKLAKFARKVKEKPKGIISKKRFRDIKKLGRK